MIFERLAAQGPREASRPFKDEGHGLWDDPPAWVPVPRKGARGKRFVSGAEVKYSYDGVIAAKGMSEGHVGVEQVVGELGEE